MTDIPVGSPPAPPGRHAAPGGWYPDPLDQHRERYWDGWQWSKNTRAVEPTPGRPQPGQASYPPPGHGYPSQPPSGQGQPGPYQGAYQQPGQYPGQPGPGGYRPQATGSQAATTADGVPLAGWWWRVLAAMIDGFLVSAIAAIPSIPWYSRLFDRLSLYIRESVQATQNGQPPPAAPTVSDLMSTSDQLILTLISLAVMTLYHLLFLRWKAATPGKLVCRMRVVPVDQGRNQAPLPWRTVLIRVAIWVLPRAQTLLALFAVVDSLFPLWHPKRQALHDLAAKTQVVKLG